MKWNTDKDMDGLRCWHSGRIGEAGTVYIFQDDRGFCPARGVHVATIEAAKSWHEDRVLPLFAPN